MLDDEKKKVLRRQPKHLPESEKKVRDEWRELRPPLQPPEPRTANPVICHLSRGEAMWRAKPKEGESAQRQHQGTSKIYRGAPFAVTRIGS